MNLQQKSYQNHHVIATQQPGSNAATAAWAARYAEQFGLALVGIPPGQKGPTGRGWNRPGGYITDPAEAGRWWTENANFGIGVVLAPSGLVSLDVDHIEHSRQALAAIGIDLDALGNGVPTIQGNPARYRLMFAAPAGVELRRKLLTWPDPDRPNDPKAALTIFELRGGPIQDCLPPTVHPDTGRPYTWLTAPGDAFPELPPPLLELWESWDSYRLALTSACPWARPFDPPGPKRDAGARPDVIGAFNASHDVAALLERHGYKRKGKGRWLAPSSQSGLAGVHLLESGRVFSHHGADPLADEHAHDAFDVFRILEYDGDTKAAVKAAALMLGIPLNTTAEQTTGSQRKSQKQPAKNRVTAEPQPDRPRIEYVKGTLPEMVRAAETALMGKGVYQRGGILARVARIPRGIEDRGIRRPAGALEIRAVDHPWLLLRLGEVAEWVMWNAEAQRYYFIDTPGDVAKLLMADSGRWSLPVLHGIVEAPTLRPDGSVLDKPGYDPASGLYFDPGSTAFPPIPDSPTRADAEAALEKLNKAISTFPFEDAIDRAVALAAILTATVRPALRIAPAFGVTAPKPSSGKTLLANLISLILTGRPPAILTYVEEANEERKRLLALLLAGEPVLLLDNVEKPLASDALCIVLTQTSFQDRLLGSTKTVTAPTAVTWLITGNNLVLAGDLNNRVLVARLDPHCERPHERSFATNLDETIPACRGELVMAALTIVRAYLAAGAPAVTPTGSRFPDWNRLVRAPLLWLGQADPLAVLKRTEADDPVASNLRRLLLTWREKLGHRAVTANELIKEAALKPPETCSRQGRLGLKEATDAKPDETEALTEALHDALVTVAGGRGGEISPWKLGNYLAKYAGRIESGLKITAEGERQGVKLWRVVEADSNPVGLVGLEGLGNAEKSNPGMKDRDASSFQRSDGLTGNNPRNPLNPQAQEARQ